MKCAYSSTNTLKLIENIIIYWMLHLSSCACDEFTTVHAAQLEYTQFAARLNNTMLINFF